MIALMLGKQNNIILGLEGIKKKVKKLLHVNFSERYLVHIPEVISVKIGVRMCHVFPVTPFH